MPKAITLAPLSSSLAAYWPWAGSRIPLDWWMRFPASLAYALAILLLYDVYGIVYDYEVQDWMRGLAFHPPLLFRDPLRTLFNFGTAPWLNINRVQLYYVLLLLVVFGVPFEIREGSRRATAVFWGTGIASGVLAGALLHPLVWWTDWSWAHHAWARPWAGGSAGCFGLMGGVAARARRPIPLLIVLLAYELVIEFVFLRSYTIAFHLIALAVGFAMTRWGPAAHQTSVTNY